MNKADLITTLLEVPNLIALLSFIAALMALGATWWFYYAPRKFGIEAYVALPLFGLDETRLPFSIHVTNTNTRQFKIKAVGFETFGRYTNRRKGASYELTLHGSGLLQTDVLLITEGEGTRLSFDGYSLANDIARGLRDANIRLASSDLKIWLYITHGTKVLVQADSALSSKIMARVNEIYSTAVT